MVFWIRLPANYAGPDLPFICNTTGSANNPGYTFAPSYGTSVAGSWGWSLFNVGASGGINVYGPVGALIEEWKWYHVAHSFKRNGTGDTYINGRLVDSRSLAPLTATVDTGLQTCIGQDPTGKYAEGADADIDDVGFFKKALTALKIQSIYAAAEVNRQSFVRKETTPTLSWVRGPGGSLTLTYVGVLQSTATVNGGWTDVAGATSPHTASNIGAAMFFRARAE